MSRAIVMKGTVKCKDTMATMAGIFALDIVVAAAKSFDHSDMYNRMKNSGDFMLTGQKPLPKPVDFHFSWWKSYPAANRLTGKYQA